MADIAPLTPLRYALGKSPQSLSRFVAPPYDVITAEHAAELRARDGLNVVRLILPDGEGEDRYANAGALLKTWVGSGVLVRDSEPAYYRYDQSFLPPGGVGRLTTRRGFLALVRLCPFSAGVVRPHERTQTALKEDRLRLMRAARANLSPAFMLYRDPDGRIDGPLQAAERVAEFSTQDGIYHALAKVTAPDAIAAITEGISSSTLVIADGHHRYESALRYSEELSLAYPDAGPRAEHRYFMTLLANGDDPSLVIFPTHRLVRSLQSFSYAALVEWAAEWFVVEPLRHGVEAVDALAALRAAGRRGSSFVAVASDGAAAVLSLRGDVDLGRHPTLGWRPDALRRADVTLLHSAILEHLLGVAGGESAARANISYYQDAAAAMRDVRSGKGHVLFLMNATPVHVVRSVVEAGEVMPPESTFFHPKVPSGLAIHTMDPSRSAPP